MSQDSQEASVHLMDYWRIFRSRLPIIITLTLLTVITGYVVTFHVLEERYSAETTIKVVKKDQYFKVFGQEESDVYDPIYFRTEFEIIQSAAVLNAVVQSENLQQLYAEKYFKSSTPLTEQQAYNLLYGSLSVSTKPGTSLISISVYSDNPNEAAKLANAVADAYLDRRVEDSKGRVGIALSSLQEELEKQEQVVEEAKEEVKRLREEYGIDSTGPEGIDVTFRDASLRQKSTLLETAKTELNANETRLERLRSLNIELFINTAKAMGLLDQQITALQQRQYQIETAIETMVNGGLEANHPRVKAAKAELKTVKEQIVDKVLGLRTALEIDLEAQRKRVTDLDKEVSELEDANRQFNSEKMLPYMEAVREKNEQISVLKALEFKIKQKKIDTGGLASPVTQVAEAVPPLRPYFPPKVLFMAASAALGLFMGIGLAFFIEYLDTSVKTMDDVERFVGLPVLTVVPDGVGPLTHEDVNSPNAESYRILRAKIDLATEPGGGGRSLAVLSGGPGEGKSTTLFNLAYVCAQSGQSVLLIDADMRRPTIHSLLQIVNEAGLAEASAGQGSVFDYIRATQFDNLHVLTAGHMQQAGIGSLSSDSFAALIEELKSSYDLVLIDSPPILGISDGAVSANTADACLLVIQHRRYPRDISLRAKRAIEEVGGNLLGVVLNAVAIQSHEDYYYYSSYYYYGDSGEGQKTRKASKSPRSAQPVGALHNHDRSSREDSESF